MVNHNGIEHAGYLSFLTMLSIFPFLILFMWAVNTLGDETLGNYLIQMILESSWAGFIDALKPRIQEISSSPPHNLVTLAIVSATWTASSIFEALGSILNKSYRVHSTPTYLIRRFFSIIEFGSLIALTIAFVFVLVILPPITAAIHSSMPQFLSPFLSNMALPEFMDISYLLLFGYAFLLISMAYYKLPNRKQKFINVLPGTFFVIIAWTIFSGLFKYYITSFPQLNLIYGSIGGVIIALLYFYSCSIILIVGAELNYNLEKA